METGILERIRLIMKEYKLSERQFALKIGVTPSVINTMFQRKQDNVKLSTIVSILNAFVEINADWLVMGRGEMIVRKEYPTTEEESVSEMKEEIAIYRKTITNLNNVVERQIKRMDELEAQQKNSVDYDFNPNLYKVNK